MPGHVDLSLVIPAYEESRGLARTLAAVRDHLESRVPHHEIIVVDDGSRDDTRLVARAALRDAPGRVLRLPRNSGKGAAVRAGILESRGRRVLYSDADLSTSIEHERLLSRALDAGAQVAIATRAHRESVIARRQGLFRQSLGKTFNLMVRAAGLSSFRDTQCGFKMFEGDAGRRLFRAARIDGFAFDVEILLLAQEAGLRVVEVPVEWRDDPETRLHVVRDSARMAADLLRIGWRHRVRPRRRLD
ncbi:MAG: dolichyl-phosphate beta-glucosyltransferase [Myxococcota bacterium]